MELKDILSLTLASIAVLVTIYHEYKRKKDQARFRRYDILLAHNDLLRDEVIKLFVASETVGLRTVDALGSNDKEDPIRKKLLERTAIQLRVSGHEQIADKLMELCALFPGNCKAAETKKKEFYDFVASQIRQTNDDLGA